MSRSGPETAASIVLSKFQHSPLETMARTPALCAARSSPSKLSTVNMMIGTVPIIMFTVLNLEGLERAAHNAGVRAIVSKGECWNLLSTIEAAVSGPDRLIQ